MDQCLIENNKGSYHEREREDAKYMSPFKLHDPLRTPIDDLLTKILKKCSDPI